MKHLFATASLIVLCSGCSTRPGVDIGANAKVDVTNPVPVDVGLGQPINAKLEGPISVNIQGLATEYEGTFVTEELFSQIKEADSGEYVAALLGTPDFTTKLGDGTEIWRWKFRPKTQQVVDFSLFGSKDKDKRPSPEHVTTFVVLKDGKVQRKWRG